MKIASRFVSIIFTSALLFTGAGRVMAAPPHGLCFNYGHDGYVHDLSPGGQVERDFQRLLGGGVRCLRIAYNGFDDVQAEALARFAKTRGFYVISGGERPAPAPTPAKIQPLASPRSCAGIQRATNWFEAGYTTASPAPSKNRITANP